MVWLNSRLEYACDDSGVEVDDFVCGALVLGFKDQDSGMRRCLRASGKDEGAFAVEFLVVLKVRYRSCRFFRGRIVGHPLAGRGEEADELLHELMV